MAKRGSVLAGLGRALLVVFGLLLLAVAFVWSRLPKAGPERVEAAPGIVGVMAKGSYAWVVKTQSGAVLVDAGMDPDGGAVIPELERMKLAPKDVKAVLLTHAHGDHWGGTRVFPDAKLYLGEADVPVLRGEVALHAPMGRMFKKFSPAMTPPSNVEPVKDGQVLELDGAKFQAIATPGHTPGSTMYLYGDTLFTGDSLLGKGDKLMVLPSLISEDAGREPAVAREARRAPVHPDRRRPHRSARGREAEAGAAARVVSAEVGRRSGGGCPARAGPREDLEPVRLDRRLGVAVRVAAPADLRPRGLDEVLPAGGEGLQRPHVLEHPQRSAGSEHPLHLGEPERGVGHAAEHERGQHGVERARLERERLGRGLNEEGVRGPPARGERVFREGSIAITVWPAASAPGRLRPVPVPTSSTRPWAPEVSQARQRPRPNASPIAMIGSYSQGICSTPRIGSPFRQPSAVELGFLRDAQRVLVDLDQP